MNKINKNNKKAHSSKLFNRVLLAGSALSISLVIIAQNGITQEQNNLAIDYFNSTPQSKNLNRYQEERGTINSHSATSGDSIGALLDSQRVQSTNSPSQQARNGIQTQIEITPEQIVHNCQSQQDSSSTINNELNNNPLEQKTSGSNDCEPIRPPTTEELLTLSERALQHGTLKLAEGYYSTLATESKETEIGNYGLAQVYAQQGLYIKAVDKFEEIINRNSSFRNEALKYQALSLLNIAELAINKEDLNQAQHNLSRINPDLLSYDGKARLKRLTKTFNNLNNSNLKPLSNQPLKIGILLPLSGKLKKVGENMLKAAQMALFDYAPQEILLYPQDTQGTPQGSQEAFQASRQDNVDIVLGPLLAENVIAISSLANRSNTPVIAFSSDHKVAGDNIKLLNFNPLEQARKIAQHGVDKGYKRFAALIPADDYGYEIFRIFAEELKILGAELVVHDFYNPVSSDHSKALRKLVKIEESKDIMAKELSTLEEEYKLIGDAMDDRSLERLTYLRKTKPQPIIDFDALFIPASAKDMPLIASQLAYYDIDSKHTAILGMAQWNNKNILQNRAEYIRGGQFTAPPQSGAKLFENDFYRNYKEQALPSAILAYDSISIISQLFKNHQYDYKQANRRMDFKVLNRPEGFIGASGAFRFNNEGITERVYDIMEIRSRSFTQVEKASKTLPPALPNKIDNRWKRLFDFGW